MTSWPAWTHPLSTTRPEVAAALQVECHAVHSVADGMHPSRYLTAAARKHVEQRMHSQMKRLIRRARAEVQAVHVTYGNVAESLPQFARGLRAQILVMGIISRRWMKRFVIGDTGAIQVLQESVHERTRVPTASSECARVG